MSLQPRSFRLADKGGAGVRCDDDGLFVGETPLLERGSDAGSVWRPRPLGDLNDAVGDRYGLPVDLAAKLRGLTSVAGALNRGEGALAKMIALHLQLPDPPPPGGERLSDDDLIALAYRMQVSGMLAKVFDENKHPRQPAGAPDGGQFAPAGNDAADAFGTPASRRARRRPGPRASRPRRSQVR